MNKNIKIPMNIKEAILAGNILKEKCEELGLTNMIDALNLLIECANKVLMLEDDLK